MLPQLVKRLKDNHLAEPKVGADFTGRVEEERTIVAALSREGGALTISAAQVAPLLPPSPSAAIVTSRQALFLEAPEPAVSTICRWPRRRSC